MDGFSFAPLHAGVSAGAVPPPPILTGVLYAEDFDLLDFEAMPAGLAAAAAASMSVAPQAPETTAVAALTEADLEETRLLARAEGAAAAMAAADQQAAQSGRRAMDALAASLGDARAEGARLAEEHAEAIARLVLSTLAANLPATCARHGEAEARALVRALLPHLSAEPQVVIRCSPHDADGMRAELARLGPDAPAAAQVVPTDAVVPGDVRVTWQGGGATRDARRAWAAVHEALAPLGLLDADAVAAGPPAPLTAPPPPLHTATTTDISASKAAPARAPVLQDAEMEHA